MGAGLFQENDNAEPVKFENGGIIVQCGHRCKFFSLEEFRAHFYLEGGVTLESLLQVNFQTPRK
jgi:hypothetical protein